MSKMEQVQAQEALRNSLAQLETILASKTWALLQASLDALSARIAILDDSGVILAANASWLKAFGNAPSKRPVDGTDYRLDGCAPAEVCAGIERVVDRLQDDFHSTYADGEVSRVHWYRLRASRFEHFGISRVVVVHEDVTDIIETKHALSELGSRLLALQDAERQRIAAELHDSTCQHIVAASLNLMRMRAAIGENAGALELCEQIEASLDQGLKELRTFTYLLHPPSLDSEGLKATVDRFVEGFSARTSLKARARIDGRIDRLPAEVQCSVLRIMQEALANIHRHAGATGFTIVMKLAGAALAITISDNGHGMRSVEKANGKGHLPLGVGIPGMRARTEQLGGAFRVSSSKTGTVVSVTIPVPALREPIAGDGGPSDRSFAARAGFARR